MTADSEWRGVTTMGGAAAEHNRGSSGTVSHFGAISHPDVR